MIWGWIKNYHRKTCTYDFADLENETTGLMHTITSMLPISFVRRAFNHCQRWMAYYRKGLTGPILEFAVRNYKSHRTIPDRLIDEIREKFKK